MLYYLIQLLERTYEPPGFQVIEFVTVRATLAAITALIIAMVIGRRIISWLKRKQLGEQVRSGPQSGAVDHSHKRGTPTMGGLIILGAIAASTVLWADLGEVYVWLIVLATLWMGGFGFADDYIKTVRRDKAGLAPRLKITGLGETEENILIEKTMVVEFYEAYPDIAMIWAVYRNPDLERPIRITRITNQFFRMDASLTDPQASRHGLQCFHYDQLVHGEGTKPLLDLDFARTVTTASPGFARVAFWNSVMGMTVASRPPEAGRLTIPVETARDRRLEVSFRYDLDRILEPEEELVGPKGFVMVYEGDYGSGLAREKAMMGGE